MIAALYARVSTTDQDNAIQIAELKRYAQSRGWLEAVYSDQMSGGKNDRPGLQAVMEAAEKRLVDVVIVTKLDRFGRSVQDLLNNLNLLERAGVRFIAVSQGIDTDRTNPVSTLLLQVLAAIAQFETSLIRERVTAGIKRAKEKGVKFGRNQKVFNREQAREMRESGATIRQIAETLEVGTGTVHRLVRDVPKRPSKTLVDVRWKGGRFAGAFGDAKG